MKVVVPGITETIYGVLKTHVHFSLSRDIRGSSNGFRGNMRGPLGGKRSSPSRGEYRREGCLRHLR